ncbi:hypothetical protein Trydic_g8704 [Trypoxylus dichotomus]
MHDRAPHIKLSSSVDDFNIGKRSGYSYRNYLSASFAHPNLENVGGNRYTLTNLPNASSASSPGLRQKTRSNSETITRSVMGLTCNLPVRQRSANTKEIFRLEAVSVLSDKAREPSRGMRERKGNYREALEILKVLEHVFVSFCLRREEVGGMERAEAIIPVLIG